MEKLLLMGDGEGFQELQEITPAEHKIRTGTLNQVVQEAHGARVVETRADRAGGNGDLRNLLWKRS